MKQLVYCRRSEERFPVQPLAGAVFVLLSCPAGALRHILPLARCFGLLGFIKVMLKLATRGRRLYCVVAEGRVAHYGWVSFSFCRYYRVSPGDVVIGPILTDDRFRGRGYATQALMRCINALVASGSRVFWIDTAEDNLPCRKVIEKCGFGDPVDSYERPADGL